LPDTSSPAGRNLKLTVAYDGTLFHGWQLQPGLRTVQGTLGEALSSLTGEAVEVCGASRTDQGVHALGQVASFHTRTPIPTDRLAGVLNGRLPEDIRVRKVADVDGRFHARFDALAKHYRYLIERGETGDVFLSRRTYRFVEAVDIPRLREAAQLLVGEHDFASFQCVQPDPREDTVRVIHRLSVEEDGRLLSIDVWGNGFLYKMVRTMAGSLLEVGRGKWTLKRLEESLKALDRRSAGPTLPGQGLCLLRVYYDPTALANALQSPAPPRPRDELEELEEGD